MKFSKKGLTWAALIEVTLALIIILGTAWFFADIYGMFAGKQEGQITVSNFNGMSNVISELLEQEDGAEDSFPFNIEKDYALIGFNKGTSSSDSYCVYKVPETLRVNKPINYCGEGACICLYRLDDLDKLRKGDISNSDLKPVVPCETFLEVDSFLVYDVKGINEGTSYSDYRDNLFVDEFKTDPTNLFMGKCKVPLEIFNLHLIKKGTEDVSFIIIKNYNSQP